MSYDNGQKRQWRRSMIARAVKRLSVPIKHAVVLYFPAEDDLDREFLIRAGFREDNLICIDRSEDVVSVNRARGSLAIHGELSAVVGHWKADLPIHFLWGDFVGQLTDKRLKDIAGMATLPPLRDAVFCFNFRQGRERKSDLFFDLIQHRGQRLLNSLVCGWSLCISNDDTVGLLLSRLSGSARMSFLSDLALELLEDASPVYYRYRSASGYGRSVFDSVTFKNPLKGLLSAEMDDTKRDLKRSISAVLAHRTRRL